MTVSLEKLIAHCRSTGAGGFTPYDFPEAELSQEEHDSIIRRINRTKKPN